MTLLKEINARGTTIIMVTHDTELAAQAKRNIHVRDGRVSENVGCKTMSTSNSDVTPLSSLNAVSAQGC